MIGKTVVGKLISKLSGLDSEKVRDVAIEIVVGSGIIENKVREQLSRGEYADGNNLPDYSEASVEVFGKKEGAMTLNDTGEYYKSIYSETDKESIIIQSQPIKGTKQENIEIKYGSDYGETILGLQDENKEEVKEAIWIELKHVLDDTLSND